MRMNKICRWGKSLLLLFSPLLLKGQNIDSAGSRLLVRSFVSTRSVALRFFPSTRSEWKNILTHGLIIERFRLDDSMAGISSENMTPVPFRGLPENRWLEIGDSIPQAAFIRGYLLQERISENTGIKDILASQKEEEDGYLFATLLTMQNSQLARYSGLLFDDTSVLNGASYFYKIYYAFDMPQDTMYQLVNMNNQSVLPPLDSLNVEHVENSIMLTWNNELYYSHQFIERSMNGGITFEHLTAEPLIFGLSVQGVPAQTYVDRVVDGGDVVMYRRYALDFFGNRSAYSPVSRVRMGNISDEFDLTLLSGEDRDGIFLECACFDSGAFHNPNNFIERSNSIDGDFKRLNIVDRAKGAKYYPDSTGYYRAGIMANGKPLVSGTVFINLPDTIAPGPVILMSCETDTIGRVHLVWKELLDKDIYGYKIFRGNDRKSEFSAITPEFLSAARFDDTVNLDLLRDSIFYYVIASDIHFNESRPSDIYGISLPDRHRPQTPFISNAVASDKGVNIEWECHGQNLKSVFVERQEKVRGRFCNKRIFFASSDSFHFTDTTCSADGEYCYQLRTKGTNDILSDTSVAVYISLSDANLLPEIGFSYIRFDSAHRIVTFYWSRPSGAEISHYRILSKNRLGHIATVAMVDGYKEELIWNYRGDLEKMEYSIIAYTNDGRRTKL